MVLPAEVAFRLVLAPLQIATPLLGVTEVGAAGNALTVIADVVLVHPVAVSVKVNVGLPTATPATTPPLVTVAHAVLLLVQVPPVVGDKVVFGSYDKPGNSAVTLTGMVNGVQQKFSQDVTFDEKTDTSKEWIAKLWATRRVGYLLDEIRLHGESVSAPSCHHKPERNMN